MNATYIARRPLRAREHTRQAAGPGDPAAPVAGACDQPWLVAHQRARRPRARRRPEPAPGLARAARGRPASANRCHPGVADRPRLSECAPRRQHPRGAPPLARGLSLLLRLDTTSPFGEALFHITAAYAQLERAVLAERVRAGMERAARNGIKVGRPRVTERPLFAERWAHVKQKILTGALSRRQAATKLKVGIASIHRLMAADQKQEL